MKVLKTEQGFTLVELMVVVAIIGLLSAVAIPNFKKYQAKAKTSEAKLQLSAIYTAEQAWYGDYNTYGSCLNLMGYDPAQERLSRYYATGFPVGTNLSAANAPDDLAVQNGAPPACDAASTGNNSNNPSSNGANVSAWGAGKVIAGATPMAAANVVVAATAAAAGIPGLAVPANTAGVATFTAGAIGVIDGDKDAATEADAWTINEDKRIVNGRAGY